MVPLKGSVAKTHLMTFLQCLKDGTIYWSDTKRLMTCPEGQLALAEHLKHGMFYEVFSYECVAEDKAALVKLCQADNFDSAFALGETELQLLRCIHSSLTTVRPPVGKTQWDVIKDLVAASCGQRWSDEDVIAVYNLAKVIGEVHLNFLCQTVSIHVPWDEICVRPADFHSLARISPTLPWVKVALLTAQYFPPEGRTTKAANGKNYGDLISKGDWERIARAIPASLKSVESFLAYLAGVYMETAGLPGEALALEIPAAFARTARAVLLAKDLDSGSIDTTKIEAKLRQKLAPAELPPPFHVAAVEDDKKVPTKATKATKAAIQPDTLPALTFEDGEVVEDVSVLARAKSLVMGCRVRTLRPVRSIRKGGEGTLVALGKEALVSWDEGALMDVSGEGRHERSVPLASLTTALEAAVAPC